MSLRRFIVRIKRRETPLYERLYHLLKSVQSVDLPVFTALARFLYSERLLRVSAWNWLVQNFYYIPMFKGRCSRYGKNLRIIDGIPQIYGDLKIDLGDNCTFHGTTTLVGAKVFDEPTLKVGNNVHFGYNLAITVGSDITIGNDVMIAGGVSIFSYDTHSTSPLLRHTTPPKETGKAVVIEDNVWIGTRAIIFKGASVGKNSVVAAGSVVTQRVPANCLALGNPARNFPFMQAE